MGQAPSQREHRSSPVGLDPPLHDALTDLHTYVLLLDAEWERLGHRIDDVSRAHGSAEECFALTELRINMGEELDALRAAVTALREHADAQLARAQSRAER